MCFYLCRHLFPKDLSKVSCVTLHKPSQLLVVGFVSGVFSLYEMPDFNLIHSLRLGCVCVFVCVCTYNLCVCALIICVCVCTYNLCVCVCTYNLCVCVHL